MSRKAISGNLFYLPIVGGILILLLIPLSAWSSDIEVSTFMNIGAAKTNASEAYLDRISDNIEWGDSGLGINLSSKLSRDLSAQAQLFSHDANDGVIGDWYFIRYRVSPGTVLKLGKLKYPGNMYSEVPDVGHAYLWVRPVQELYGHNEANIAPVYESLFGASIAKTNFVGDDWEMNYTGFVGKNEAEDASEPNMNNIFGVRFSMTNEVVDLFVTAMTGEFEFVVAHGEDHGEEEEHEGEEEEEEHEGEEEEHEEEETNPLDGKNQNVISLGGKLNLNNFIALFEYSMVDVDDFDDLETDIWYATFGYQMNRVTPHITFAEFDQESGLAHESITFGLKYQLTPESVGKIEYQQIDPSGEAGEAGVFYEETPDDDTVNVFSISYSVMF